MAYQFGSLLSGGFTPIIATTLFAATGQTGPVGLYVASASVLMLRSIAGLGSTIERNALVATQLQKNAMRRSRCNSWQLGGAPVSKSSIGTL